MIIFNSLYFTQYYHFLHVNSKVFRIEEAVTYLDIYIYITVKNWKFIWQNDLL